MQHPMLYVKSGINRDESVHHFLLVNEMHGTVDSVHERADVTRPIRKHLDGVTDGPEDDGAVETVELGLHRLTDDHGREELFRLLYTHAIII
jgi:hypothetical protein